MDECPILDGYDARLVLALQVHQVAALHVFRIQRVWAHIGIAVDQDTLVAAVRTDEWRLPLRLELCPVLLHAGFESRLVGRVDRVQCLLVFLVDQDGHAVRWLRVLIFRCVWCE